MSTRKTQNYQLHQWEATDDFLRAEFNENFTKLDEAVAAEVAARASAVNGLNTALGKKPEVFVGTYTGDGTKGRVLFRSTKGRVIALGFQPKAVLVMPSTGQLNASYCYFGGLAVMGSPVAVKDNEVAALTATGFRVSHTAIYHNNYTELFTVNESEKRYHYLAIK